MTKIELLQGKKLGLEMWFVVVRQGNKISVKSFMSEALARTEYSKLTK